MSDSLARQEIDLARQYWDLANYVLGFASVHFFAFLFALTSQPFFRTNVQRGQRAAYAAIAIFTLIYLLALMQCHGFEGRVLSTSGGLANDYKTAALMMSGRIAVGRYLWLLFIAAIATVSLAKSKRIPSGDRTGE